jgi:hypothetical protein
MKVKTINLSDVCGQRIYTREDGHVLFKAIADALLDSEKVIVNFNNQEIASESFLDEAIVEQYMRPDRDDNANKIILEGVTKYDQSLLKRIYEYRKRLEEKEARKAKR